MWRPAVAPLQPRGRQPISAKVRFFLTRWFTFSVERIKVVISILLLAPCQPYNPPVERVTVKLLFKFNV